MTTVANAALGIVGTDFAYNGHNTTYQKGNSTNNPPTWTKTRDITGPDTVESAIGFAYETGVNNTADVWVPRLSTVFLNTTPNTTRF